MIFQRNLSTDEKKKKKQELARKNRVQNNISKVCYPQPNEKLQKGINCKYPEHNSCFRTYPKNLLTNRLAAVQLPPLCKTIEKMAEGSNKNENYLFPSSFLPSFLSFQSNIRHQADVLLMKLSVIQRRTYFFA